MAEGINWNRAMLEAELAVSASENNITIVDETGAPAITYVGIAVPGTPDNSNSWKLKRITVAGAITTVKFANGSNAYDQNYSTRAGVTNWL